MNTPFNMKVLAAARKIVQVIQADPGEPRSCMNCGGIFFSPTKEQLVLIDQALPGKPDFQDVDNKCPTCVEISLKEK